MCWGSKGAFTGHFIYSWCRLLINVNVDAVAASVSVIFLDWQCVFKVTNVQPNANNTIYISEFSVKCIVDHVFCRSV